MIRDNAREFFSSRVEKPALGVMSRLGLSPNAVTVSGLLTAGVGAYLLSAGWLLAGGVVYWLSGLMDLLDGALARATGRETRWGALLDSLTDRVAESVVLLGILVFYLDEGPKIGGAVVFATLASSFMVSYVRARAEGLGIECKVGMATRPERVVLLGAGLITGEWWKPAVMVVLVVVAALSAFTAGQRAIYVYRRLNERDAATSGSTGAPLEDR